jgi:hypothetical protein
MTFLVYFKTLYGREMFVCEEDGVEYFKMSYGNEMFVCEKDGADHYVVAVVYADDTTKI